MNKMSNRIDFTFCSWLVVIFFFTINSSNHLWRVVVFFLEYVPHTSNFHHLLSCKTTGRASRMQLSLLGCPFQHWMNDCHQHQLSKPKKSHQFHNLLQSLQLYFAAIRFTSYTTCALLTEQGMQSEYACVCTSGDFEKKAQSHNLRSHENRCSVLLINSGRGSLIAPRLT